MLSRLRKIVEARCVGWGGKLIELERRGRSRSPGARTAADLDSSRFVNNLKTTSSRLLGKEFADKRNRVDRKPVLWSRSYCITSCGGVPLSILKQYIERP